MTTILEPPLIERLRAAADEVEEFPHPSHCEHLHNASSVMREAALAIEAASAQLTREAERWYRALIAERNDFAQQAGECSGAVQTMQREIAALKRDLHTRELAEAEAMALVLSHEGRIARLTAERDAAREDAERWRHALAHGFPVRNQTYRPGRVWIAFPGEFGGDTPEQAIDAARKGSDTGWTPESHLGAVSDPQPYPPVKPARKGSANG